MAAAEPDPRKRCVRPLIAGSFRTRSSISCVPARSAFRVTLVAEPRWRGSISAIGRPETSTSSFGDVVERHFFRHVALHPASRMRMMWAGGKRPVSSSSLRSMTSASRAIDSCTGTGPVGFPAATGAEGVEARARRGWTLLGRRALGLREIDHDLFQFVEIGVLARFVEVRQPGPRETRRRPLGTRIHPLDARLQRAEREFSVRVALPRLGAHTSRR